MTTSTVTTATPPAPSGEEELSPRPDETSVTDRDDAPTTSASTTSLPTATSPPAELEQATPTTVALPPDSLRFVEVAKGAKNPIFLAATPGASHSYLAEQGGRILYLHNDEIAGAPVLDITEKVTFRGEQGLLGIALHPAQPTRLFLHYSNQGGHTVVSEFLISADGKDRRPRFGEDRLLRSATRHQPQRRDDPVRTGRLPLPGIGRRRPSR